MPNSTTILVRAEHWVKAGGTETIRFFPHLPPLTTVCRETRQEYPLNLYYGQNTFFFTDNMAAPSTLSAFFKTRGEPAEAVVSAKMSFLAKTIGTLPGSVVTYRIRFTAGCAKNGPVDISNLQRSQPECVWSAVQYAAELELCCCYLYRVVRKSTTLASVLLAFSKRLAEDEQLAEAPCPQCGKVTGVVSAREVAAGEM